MLYINGEWRDAASGKTFDVKNPATGEVVATVAKGSTADTEAAIEAAQAAFGPWSRLTAKERYTYLKKTADILRARTEEIAELITREMGKPVAEARGEIGLAIDYLDWYAEEGKRIYGDTIPASAPNKRLLVLRQPVGVVGAITPWNFPIAMITRKLAPALAAGCTILLKAASATPLAAIEVFKALHEAGVPKGVANLVNGSASEVVGAMMASPVVRKITFTGSTEVGKELVRQSADTMKKVSMELGGHAPFLVFEDADLDKAADGAIASKFRNAGQTCVCTNRIYVQKSVAERFSAIMAEKMKSMVVGNGLESGVNVGPMIDEGAMAKAQEHIDDAVAKGATILCGGGRLTEGAFANGNFFAPTVLSGATHEMKISYEETFGPVAPIFTFETEAEAIQLANATVFGLASYIFTKDGSRMFRVAEQLDYGIVGINDAMPTVAQAPFGGVKESGVGREGGKYGIEDYLDYKFLSLQIEL
ncbi:NAD-dependent succinate-semialdehyde dehydrogenase [Brevibacillus invocatus]|uniref:NAD-dependent succinate-semialdehyde dehydrogenase n=1 Tax=Brevibacillus invocatus TaxID=173959 RepID=UPI00203C354E|nr:NAD-dependent succinate-semialdehyde dehydrogenase [Brevibacillus invocatus]MCM3082012.1 NAD-dependent succinate-semialdehyde dehydrogenase [Brevibacillus invocatus]MCM3432416.1 NAD-dependent succinate-semialdehyde dehydrogenase [Brevibacillus invocatus]